MRPISEYIVVALPAVYMSVVLRYTRYPVTPTLSVDAVQERSICVGENTTPLSDGAEGGVVSAGAGVVSESILEYPLVFPAPSYARAR